MTVDADDLAAIDLLLQPCDGPARCDECAHRRLLCLQVVELQYGLFALPAIHARVLAEVFDDELARDAPPAPPRCRRLTPVSISTRTKVVGKAAAAPVLPAVLRVPVEALNGQSLAAFSAPLHVSGQRDRRRIRRGRLHGHHRRVDVPYPHAHRRDRDLELVRDAAQRPALLSKRPGAGSLFLLWSHDERMFAAWPDESSAYSCPRACFGQS